jgi:putative peptidoglycan lipid II flippase
VRQRDDAGVRRAVSAVSESLMLNAGPVGPIALAIIVTTLIPQFTPADTVATSAALACFAPGLIGYSAVKLMSPAFYAMGDSRVPVIASAASVVFNVALNLMLVRSLGHRGLALGTAAAALLNAGILCGSRDASALTAAAC